MGELTVWGYWEGPLHAYIALCMETVRRHHPDVRVLDRAGFDAVWHHDRDVPIDHLRVELRADFVRAYLLRHHGGVWLDADFVLLRPLDVDALLPASRTFAGYRIDDGDFTNNLMISRAGDPVVAELYARVCEHLRLDLPVHWLELGACALAPAIEAHPDAVHEIDADLVCPIPWHQVARLEAPGDAGDLVDGRRWGVMLANRTSGAALQALTREQVLAAPTLLGDLLRRALA